MTTGAEQFTQMPVAQFIAATAAKQATPGGGSVAGVVGALAAGLGQMSVSFSRGKKKLAGHADAHERIFARLERAREMFQQLVADDMAAFAFFQEAGAADEASEKDAQVQLALAAAIDVPRETAKLSLAVLDDLFALVDKCSRWLVTDLLAGATLAAAVTELCDYNVRINARSLPDGNARRDLTEASRADVERARERLDALRAAAEPMLQ
jgi:formiminotetrahydrofolate cyclodeaminase